MKLGIIGRGPWGNVYAETLRRMGVDFWQAGRDLCMLEPADGIIIASAAHSHSNLAEVYLEIDMPVLIEKPVAMRSEDARLLLECAERNKSIAFAGHTRLYSGRWRKFKARALSVGIESISAIAGGPCRIDPLWDWGPHLVAMCLDLGFDPLKARIVTGQDAHGLTVIVNRNLAFMDGAEIPRPLEVLLNEFIAAIEKGEPDIRGLELGVKVVEAIERIGARSACPAYGT